MRIKQTHECSYVALSDQNGRKNTTSIEINQPLCSSGVPPLTNKSGLDITQMAHNAANFHESERIDLWPLLLTWIDYNPNMDK